jgi:peptide/nickel transport system permease protein
LATYIARRLLAFAPTLLVVSLLLFLLLDFIPGDPTYVLLGNDAGQTEVEALMERLGLDRPLHERVLEWYGKALRGDLGRSYYLGMGVSQAILERVPVTFTLAAASLLLALLIAVPVGIIAAVNSNTWVDAVIMLLSLAALSVPNFVIGLLLIYLVAIPVPWVPIGGYVPLWTDPIEAARHLLLPVTALGFSLASLVARMTRASMLEVLNLDYIRTARAKGIRGPAVVIKHGFRNALIPVITVVGLAAGAVLSGSVVTETVFNIPGMGRLVVNAVQRRDYPLVQGVILFLTFSYLMVNLVTDLLYAAANPRVRYS